MGRRRNDFDKTTALITVLVLALALALYFFKVLIKNRWLLILFLIAVGIGICVLLFYLAKQEEIKRNKYIKNLHKSNTTEKTKKTIPEQPLIKRQKTPTYQKKELLTACEKEWKKALSVCIPNGYFLKEQICLASIIEKTENNAYANELFRIVDFGVFDDRNNIKILIEINDSSHERPDRMARDYKVKNICEQAGIPLIRFWTKYDIDYEYIRKRIYQELKI